jgi:hypothetical protein
MEDLIGRTVVQTCALSPECSAMLGSFWQWSFWASFAIGVVGGAVSFFLRRSETV